MSPIRKQVGMKLGHDFRQPDIFNICGGGGFIPSQLPNLRLWLENKVLARTAWNEAGKQHNDSSGEGNNGTGGSGIGLSFTQSNQDHVISPNQFHLDTDGAWTMCFMAHALATGDNYVLSDNITQNQFFRFVSTSNFQVKLLGAVNVQFTGIDVVAAGDFFVIKSDGSEVEIFQNNVSKGTAAITNNGTYSFDGMGKAATSYTDATWSMVGLWNADIDESTLYNGPQDFLEQAQNANCLIAYLCADLGEDALTVFDYSPNHNHGTYYTNAASPYAPYDTGLGDGYMTSLGGYNLYGVTAGTGTVSSSGTAITGTGTSFTTEYEVNDVIFADNEGRRITAITDNTNMTVASAFSSALSGDSHDRYNLGDTGTYEALIFGTAYNSTNDIFGNATGYQDNIDLTVKSADAHSPVIQFASTVTTVTQDFFCYAKIKFNDNNTAEDIVGNAASTVSGFRLRIGSTGKIEFRSSNNAAVSSTTMLDGEEWHVFGVDDGNTTQIYMGKTPAAIAADGPSGTVTTPAAPTNNLKVGQNAGSTGNKLSSPIKGDVIVAESVPTLTDMQDLATYVDAR